MGLIFFDLCSPLPLADRPMFKLSSDYADKSE